jgi:hypothetical protein
MNQGDFPAGTRNPQDDVRLRRRMLTGAFFAFIVTGGLSAMPATPEQPVRKNAWPLKFKKHSFQAYWYNTLKCEIIYDNFNFTQFRGNAPAGPPPMPNYKDFWDAGYLGVHNFPPPAQVNWVSLDGSSHSASIDFAAIFKDELVLHHVPEAEVADIYPEIGPDPGIILEVNDRTISVYMKVMIATKTLREPGNKNSDYRDDLIPAWSHIY